MSIISPYLGVTSVVPFPHSADSVGPHTHTGASLLIRAYPFVRCDCPLTPRAKSVSKFQLRYDKACTVFPHFIHSRLRVRMIVEPKKNRSTPVFAFLRSVLTPCLTLTFPNLCASTIILRLDACPSQTLSKPGSF